MKYFFRTFLIYLLLIVGFSFILIDKNIDDLSGQEVESTVEFVYEVFIASVTLFLSQSFFR